MDELVEKLDMYIENSPEANSLRKDTQLRTIIGKFFDGVYDLKSEQKEGCLVQKNKMHHKTVKKSFINAQNPDEFPEVMSFNLCWPNRQPDPTGVLKALISIPETFNVSDLYESRSRSGHEYALRGMICFGHNHYFAFFRRIFIKIGFLTGLDYSNIEEQAQRIKNTEVKPETEWILYDDDHLSFVQDNWTGVLHSCLDNQAIPTVLFYEKLVSDIEEDAEYKKSREFTYVKLELNALQKLAQQFETQSDTFSSKKMVEE